MSSVEKIRQLKKLVNEADRILVWQTEIYEAIHNIDPAWIPDLDASKITTGIFDLARIPGMDWAHISDLFQRGSDSTDAGGDATVTFPEEFAAAPLVFLQGVDAGAKGIVLDVVSKSTTQVVVKARKVTGITSGAGTAHNHTFSDSFWTSLVSAGTPSGTIGGEASHYHLILVSGPPTGSDGTFTDFGWVGTPRTFWANEGPMNVYTGVPASHTHSFTGDAMDTHRHSGTASGTTGAESAHTHPVAAPVLAIAFDWLAVTA